MDRKQSSQKFTLLEHILYSLIATIGCLIFVGMFSIFVAIVWTNLNCFFDGSACPKQEEMWYYAKGQTFNTLLVRYDKIKTLIR